MMVYDSMIIIFQINLIYCLNMVVIIFLKESDPVLGKSCDLTLMTSRRSHLERFLTKFLSNFSKFIGKNLCQSLFFNKVASLLKKILYAGVFR